MSFINAKIIGENFTRDQYMQGQTLRGHPGYIMTRSSLMEFDRCPAKWIKGEQPKKSAAMNWGSLIDCLLTGPERFDSLFVVQPEKCLNGEGEEVEFSYRTKSAKEWRTSIGSKTPIAKSNLSDAKKAASIISENERIKNLFLTSRKQICISAVWCDALTAIEIPVRALPDLVPDKNCPDFGRFLVDLKTTRNGDPEKWANEVNDKSYDVQAALDVDLYEAATGEGRNQFAHVIQENILPFHLVDPPAEMTVEFIQWGRMKYKAALRRYARCLHENYWPSYRPTGEVIFGKQSIAPDLLWDYKRGKGMTAFIPPPEPKEETYSEKTGDNVP